MNPHLEVGGGTPGTGGVRPRSRWLRPVALLAVIVVVAGLPLLLGADGVVLGQIEFILALSLAAIGLNIVSGYAGQLALGPGAMFAIGAYTAAVLAANFPWAAGLLFMCVSGTLAAVLAGLVIAIPSLRAGGFYLGMVTLLIAAAVPTVVSNLAVTGGSGGILLLQVSWFNQVPGGIPLYLLMVVLVVVFLIFSWALLHSRLGRRFGALRSGEVLASSLGISGYRTKLLAFVLAAIPTGMAGVLYVYSQQVMSPQSATTNLSIDLLAVVVIGGFGTVIGPLLGSAIVFGSGEFLGGLQELQGIVYGVLLLLVVEFMPEGLAGSDQHWGGFLGRVGGGRHRRTTTAGDVSVQPRSSAALEVPRIANSNKLVLTGVRKSFGGIGAVSGVDLVVCPGTVHAVIGPNGSGKTTLVNLISGYQHPDSGEIALGERRLDGLRPYRLSELGIARTFQTPRLNLDTTVIENVMVAADRRVRGRDFSSVLRGPGGRRADRESKARALQCLASVGLAGLAEEPADKMPHGIQRLIEVARAISMSPRFILLDEPAAGLATAEIENLTQMIRGLTQSGVGILLVEHNVPVVLDISDEITVLNFGEVIRHGSPEDVRRDPDVIRVFLGVAQTDAGTSFVFGQGERDAGGA